MMTGKAAALGRVFNTFCSKPLGCTSCGYPHHLEQPSRYVCSMFHFLHVPRSADICVPDPLPVDSCSDPLPSPDTSHVPPTRQTPRALVSPSSSLTAATSNYLLAPMHVPHSNTPSNGCSSIVFDVHIPDEDPTRPVELIEDDDQDAYIGFAQDGIGDEEDFAQNDDIDADPAEADRRSESSQNGHEKRQQSRVRQLPQWLLSAFLHRVAESAERDTPDKLPPLYRRGMFWFPRRASYFLLNVPKPSPQALYSEPPLFLWDPLALHPIPCPSCGARLTRNGHISHPRRVVDLNQCFWMIGYRYRCSTCTNPKTGRLGTRTYSSWDSRILSALPAELRAEFPARLSWRSGISLPLFHFMRSCFQNGMGSKQFADALRVQHLKHFDMLHLQYLHRLHNRQRMSAWPSGQTFPPFLPFDDSSPEGYRGFVPSARWLRDMYDVFAEEHTADIDQHTAMLTGDICAIDHSHKVRASLCHRPVCYEHSMNYIYSTSRMSRYPGHCALLV